MTPVALPVLDLRRAPAPPRRPALRLVRPEPAVTLRRACAADAVGIHRLLETFVAQQVVLPRTLSQIERSIGDFVVAVEGDRIVGSGALRRYSPELAEIGALAVAEDLHGAGIGRRLVELLLDEARAAGIGGVFALTLQDGFFHRLGFETTTVDAFPQKVAADCSACTRRHTCAEIAVAMTLAPSGADERKR